jgi:beta-lactam-binding protein with PASTA domain
MATAGDRTDVAAFTEAGARAVQAKPGAAEPAWRHPGVLAWQLLAVVSLLAIGALLAAFFLTGPQHSTATRTVTVPTASAATLAQVPDVVNQEQRSALAKLRAAGFESRVKTVPGPGTAGVVVQESPAAGTKVRKGSPITLRVSVKGVIVPSVLGLEKTVAQSKLTAAGLGARIAIVVTSPAASGQVIAQTPAGGVTAKRGTEVILAVDAGYRH